jgi:hypothetical protein
MPQQPGDNESTIYLMAIIPAAAVALDVLWAVLVESRTYLDGACFRIPLEPRRALVDSPGQRPG